MIGTRGTAPSWSGGVHSQGYGNGQGTAILGPIAEATDTTIELTPADAAAKVDEGAQLVDVRQDYEWAAGRIDGAVHIPLEQLPGRAGELDRDRPIIFQCRSGARSSFATQAFREAGYEAFNLAGGLEAWVEEGREIEPADGEVALPRPDNT